MRRKGWMALCALMLAVFPTLAAAKVWQEVRVGIEGAYPPFEFLDAKGNLAGFNVDLSNALCRQMQLKCVLVKTPWDSLIPNLRDNKIDAIISSMSITDERKKLVSFTNKYASTPYFFVARKHRTLATLITSIELQGKRVGVQEETTEQKYLEANFNQVPKVVTFKTTADMFQSLQKGDVDFILLDMVVAYEGFLKTSPGKDDFEFVGSPIRDRKWFGEGMGIAVRQQDNDLRERFNKAIDVLRQSGEYHFIARKYFAFDVYGR